MKAFQELNFKEHYDSQKDDLLNDFYIPALANSKKYRRVVGYFNSKSLASVAIGLKDFILNNGKMDLLCGVDLNPSDVNMVKFASEHPEEILTSNFLSELDSIEDEIIKNHVKVLGWMIANGLLEIKVVVMGLNKSDKGIMHYKVGINRDFDGNYICFSGSNNETGPGWNKNLEQFDVYRSWNSSESNRINSKIDLFIRTWEGKSGEYKTIDVPRAVKEKLIEIAPNNFEELVFTTNEDSSSNIKPQLFDNQEEAVKNWLSNDKRGIFAMATGTGKTFTALGCLDKIISDEDKLVTIISVPYKHLIPQWLNSIETFGLIEEFDRVINVSSSNSNGKKEFSDATSELNKNYIDKILVISTPHSMYKENFKSIISRKKHNIPYFLIADEMHELGSTRFRKALLDEYDYRLGLSATPDRKYDDFGTEYILNYFGDIVYEFPLKRAIKEINPLTNLSYLTKYDYHPFYIDLEDDELDEYYELTNKLVKIKDDGSERNLKIIENLMFKRADILKNARNKMQVLEDILNELGPNTKNLIIYCSDEQIDEVVDIVGNKFDWRVKTFTYKDSSEPSDSYDGKSFRDDILVDFSKGKYDCLVAMHCLDEGVDIPSASKAILLCNSTNPREFIQRLGRVLRRYPGKNKADIYDLIIKPNVNKKSSHDDLEKKIYDKELERFEMIADAMILFMIRGEFMDDIEIGRVLRKNCMDKDMANFLNDLFIFELTSGNKWTEKYNKKINEYYQKKVEK